MNEYKLVDVKLGYSCNNNCVHCVIADKRRELIKRKLKLDRTTEEAKKLMDVAKANGARIIVLTGGEPAIRNDIFELINYAKLLGFEIQMQTNGRMFYYKDFAEKIAKIAPIQYQFALHGSSAKIHDKITRFEGSFEQTVQGIKNLVDLKHLDQKVIGKIVISRKNFKYLPKIIELFADLGIENANVAFPHGMGNALLYFDEVVPTYTELKPYLISMIDTCKSFGIRVDVESVPFCFLQGYEKHSSELYRAKDIELRDMKSAILNYTEVRKNIAKKKFPKCKKCKYYLICEGPWIEYVKGRGSSEFKPVGGRKITEKDVLGN